MTRDEYNALEGVNWSNLKHAEKSPKHYRHEADSGDKEPTDAMLMGLAVHCAVLEPDEFARRYVVWSGPSLPPNYVLWTGGPRRGKTWESFRRDNAGCPILTVKEYEAIVHHDGSRRGNQWKAFKAANSARGILTEEQYERCLAIRDAVRSDPVAKKYLEGPGSFERVIQWTDPETGMKCKGRLDRETHGGVRILVDLKTAHDGDPRKFAKTAAQLGYHGQLAFYADGMAAIGEPVSRVVMIVVESKPPFDVTVYNVGEDVLYAGEQLYRRLLEKVNGCRALDKWPGRFLAEEEFALPVWAMPDLDGDEDGMDIDMEDML